MKLPPYPEYKESKLSWIGSIPSHWPEHRAKNYFREIDERSQTGDEEMLSVSHITGVTPRSQKKVTMFLAESNVGQKRCQPGDIVINTLWAWMSALGVSKHEGIVSPAYGVYRAHQKEFYDSYFLNRLLRIENYRSEYICRSTGIRSSRLRLYPDQFLDMNIVCPPLEEQRQIARYLNSVENKIKKFIRNKLQLIKLLKEQKQNVINQAVTRGLNPDVKLKPSGVDWIGDIPEHWEVRRLKFLARIRNGQDYKGVEAESGYPVMGSGGQFAFASDFMYEGESVLFGRKGTIDKPLYINGKFWTVDTMFYTEVSKDIFPRFLHYCALTFPFDFYSTKTALPSMTQQDLGCHPIALAPSEEQQDIIEYIETETALIDQTITRTEREIELMREYRDRLVSDIVTGKVDVRGVEVADDFLAEIDFEEPDDEPLEEDCAMAEDV